MTDTEIIKALECCAGDGTTKDCYSCSIYEIDECQCVLPKQALDLINRQKAEIERLKKKFELADGTIYDIEDALNRGEDNDWARECIAQYEKEMVGDNK